MVATPRSPLTIGKSFFIPAIMYEIVINGKKNPYFQCIKKTQACYTVYINHIQPI
jgi:hypothetical protein